MKYRDFLFVDECTNEEFIVEVKIVEGMTTEDAYTKAMKEAEDWFDEPVLIKEIDPEQAEMMGLDTY